MKKLVSIVTSAYNEELCIRELAKALHRFMAKMQKYDFEVIMVDHGSKDNTFELMRGINEADPRFKIVQLSKNFGITDYGLSAGMIHARGDAVVLMNADLQDPPEVISRFLDKWEAGYEIVYGVITKREGVSVVRKIASPLFYWFMNKITDGMLPRNATDFRLLDRKVYEAINLMPERNRFLRGMIAWTGFKKIGVPFVRAPRFAKGSEGGGAKNFNLFTFLGKTSKYIKNAVFSFSDFPVRIMFNLGWISMLATFAAGIYYLLFFIFTGKAGLGYTPGFTPLLLVMLFLFGMVFLFFGLLGEYVTRIYEESKQRPLFIVKKTIGFNTKKD